MKNTSKADSNTIHFRISNLEREIHGYLKRKSRSLKFPAPLEKSFNEETSQTRKQRFTTLSIIGIIFYNIFCICDRLMLPDIYLTAWKIRFGIVTPLMLLSLFCLRLKIFERHMDYIIGFAMTMTSVSVMIIMNISSHPNVSQYYSGILIIVMCGNIIARMHFTPALINSLLILVLYLFSVSQISIMSIEEMGNSGMVLLTSIVTSLFGTYGMEYKERKDYLLTLLDRINALKLEESNKKLAESNIKLEESNRKLERLSISDSLTGLFNRRYFDRSFDKMWRSASRNNWPISMVFIDVDYFKLYNDNYGHKAGDYCLERIGHIIGESLQRGDDFAARYGGEEFIILLSHTGMDNALKTAEQIRLRIEAIDIEHSLSPLSHITVSMGVSSVVPDSNCDSSMLLIFSDRALYTAKAEGRNRVCSEEYISDAPPTGHHPMKFCT